MSANALENPQGQPQADGESGKTQLPDGSEIGSQNVRGTYLDKTLEKNKQQEIIQKQIQPETEKEETPSAETQPTNKDNRHAAQKITELAEERINYARLAVEGNADAIYGIAEKDPKLAEKLLQEYDYGTESLEELIALRDNPEATPEELQTDSRIQELEKRVLDETVKRLKKDHPDLTDELEEEFRNMYSNEHFAKYDEEQKLNIARAATGKTIQTTSNSTLLEMLKQQEGTTITPKGGMQSEKKAPRIAPEDARMFKAAGVTEAKMAKYLPEDIDEQIQGLLNYSGGAKSK